MKKLAWGENVFFFFIVGGVIIAAPSHYSAMTPLGKNFTSMLQCLPLKAGKLKSGR